MMLSLIRQSLGNEYNTAQTWGIVELQELCCTWRGSASFARAQSSELVFSILILVLVAEFYWPLEINLGQYFFLYFLELCI